MIWDWMKVHITTWHDTGEEVVSYSHTPEEFIIELQARNERVYVTHGSCSECMYMPDRSIPKDAVQRFTNEAETLHLMPECVCTAIARYQRRPNVPDFVVCYGFYYMHCSTNKYLMAAREAHLITFYDIADLPGTRETGLSIIKPYLI